MMIFYCQHHRIPYNHYSLYTAMYYSRQGNTTRFHNILKQVYNTRQHRQPSANSPRQQAVVSSYSKFVISREDGNHTENKIHRKQRCWKMYNHGMYRMQSHGTKTKQKPITAKKQLLPITHE